MMTPTGRGIHTLAAAIGLTVLLAGCDINIGTHSTGVTDQIRKQFSITGTPEIVLKTFDGAVTVGAWDRAEVVVDVERRGADRSALDAIEVVAEQSGDRVVLEARHPPRRDIVAIGFVISPSARITATVPRQAHLTVSSGDGSITIERVNGRLDLHTGDGSIRTTDVGGDMKAYTGDGSVGFEGFTGRADVETGDGGMRLSGRFEILKLRSGDGSITVKAEPGSTMAADWEIRTGDGSVTLELPAAFAAALDAHTGDGRVYVENLDVSGVDREDRRSARGTIGAGGATLRLRTGDGTIRLKGF